MTKVHVLIRQGNEVTGVSSTPHKVCAEREADRLPTPVLVAGGDVDVIVISLPISAPG